MLKLMRDSFAQLKWILIAIVAIFILFIFVDWGGGGSAGNAQDLSYAARVNGDTISNRDYQRALLFTEQNYQRMYGQQFTPEMAKMMGLDKQVLESLIDQRLILQEAERVHLKASPEEVRKRILAMPVLNPNGQFIGPELYARVITSEFHYESPAEFEDDLGRQITIDKMESALTNSVVVSPKAAEAEYKRVTENAKIHFATLPASRLLTTVAVTPAEVEAYYKANQSKYAHGEQRDIKYLIADLAKIRATINPSDEELRKRYDAMKETDFKHPAQAHILHILIKVDPKASEPEVAAAKAKAEGIVKQLRAGADFGALARANSGDPSSAGNGGDMGFIDRGMTVEAFDNAAFTIPLNQISDPIRTPEYGFHIIKVLERRPEGYRSFEEVRPQLQMQVVGQMATDQARDVITATSRKVKEAKPKTADEFAKFASGVVASNEAQWFGKNDQIPGLGNNQPLATWVFAAKPGDVGDVIGTNRGPIIPYLVGTRQAGVSPLSEIKDKVENDAKMAKARELAKQQMAAAMAGAPNVDAVAAKIGVTATDTTLNRQGQTGGVQGDASALIDAAMTAPVGQLTGPIVAGDGAIAFQVLEQKKVDPKELEASRASYIDTLRQQQARALRTSLVQQLRKGAKIEINQKVLDRQNAQSSQSGM